MPETSLPEGIDDAVVNRAQLARALGKSEPTIDRFIGDGMPVLTEGTNGRSYEFQLSACYGWVVERDRSANAVKEAAERAVDQLRLVLVGGNGLVGDEEASLSPRARQEIYDAERAFMLVALQRRQLVNRNDVVEGFEQIFRIVRDALTALPDRLEREAGLSGKAIELAVNSCDGALAEMHREIERRADDALTERQAAE